MDRGAVAETAVTKVFDDIRSSRFLTSLQVSVTKHLTVKIQMTKYNKTHDDNLFKIEQI